MKYGPVFKTSLLGYPMYLVADHAFSKEVQKGTVTEFMVPGRAFYKLVGDLDHMKDEHHATWVSSCSDASCTLHSP